MKSGGLRFFGQDVVLDHGADVGLRRRRETDPPHTRHESEPIGPKKRSRPMDEATPVREEHYYWCTRGCGGLIRSPKIHIPSKCKEIHQGFVGIPMTLIQTPGPHFPGGGTTFQIESAEARIDVLPTSVCLTTADQSNDGARLIFLGCGRIESETAFLKNVMARACDTDGSASRR